MNKHSIIGYLGRDVEIRYMPDGRGVATLSVATHEQRGEKRYTEWHRVVVFAQKLVEKMGAIYLKGKQVFIEGRTQTRKWTDRDGIDRWTTEIVIDSFGHRVQLLGSNPASSQNQPPRNRVAEKQAQNQAAINQMMPDEAFVPPEFQDQMSDFHDDDDDDIPF